MATAISPVKVEVAAPDAATAFMLERRLSHLAPTVVGQGSEWSVELDADSDRLEEIEAAVRRWLWEEALTEATVVTGDRKRRLHARRSA
jgi:hypothetical protein